MENTGKFLLKISLFCFLIHFEEVPHIAAGHLMVIIIIQFDLHFEAGTVPLIPILEIKDPSNHGSLILQPMFLGTFEQFVVYLSSTISSLSPLPLNSFPPSLANLSSSICDFRWSLVSHFSTTDKTAADEALSSFCLFLAGRKSCPFIFPKIFTNLSAHPCHKYSQNLPSSAVLQKHQTLQEFWHCY